MDADIRLLFTENDTNMERLFGAANASPYVKDGINEAVVHGRLDRVNPAGSGTKVAAHFHGVQPGETKVVYMRFSNRQLDDPFGQAEAIFTQRIQEADEFYAAVQSPDLNHDERSVQRQGFAGLLWSKQFYHYGVQLWLEGDSANPPPPASRKHGRNADWKHLYNLDVISSCNIVPSQIGQPLRSSAITAPSPLLQVAPSLYSALVLSYLVFFPCISPLTSE